MDFPVPAPPSIMDIRGIPLIGLFSIFRLFGMLSYIVLLLMSYMENI